VSIVIVGSKEIMQEDIMKLNDNVNNILIAEGLLYFFVVAIVILLGWL
jgi:hypothetical protein